MIFRLLLLALLLVSPAWAATATSTCTVASGWATTPNNALAGPDGSFATTAVTGQPLLSVTSCAMAVPAGGTITGIQVRVVSCGSGTSGQKALLINILGLGACTGKVTTSTPATCPTTVDQGLNPAATNDLWGCPSVSLSNVNATTFGASVQTNTSNSATNSVDLISITVTYTPGVAGAAGSPQRFFFMQ